MVSGTIEIFPAKVDQITNTPDSPVGRAVKHVAEVLFTAARPRIGDQYSGHHGVRLKDTGQVINTGGSSYMVKFTKPLPSGQDLAILHHQGAPSHSMPAKSGKSRYYRAGPGVVTSQGDKVFGPTAGPIAHTGSPGNPYLLDAADQIGLRRSGALLRGPNRLAPVVRIRI